eukprot:490514-Rhodomonas_salina.2
MRSPVLMRCYRRCALYGPGMAGRRSSYAPMRSLVLKTPAYAVVMRSFVLRSRVLLPPHAFATRSPQRSTRCDPCSAKSNQKRLTFRTMRRAVVAEKKARTGLCTWNARHSQVALWNLRVSSYVLSRY